MYILIKGNLLDIFGESARGHLDETHGIKFTPEYQNVESMVSIGEIIDESKLSNDLLNNPNIIILNNDDDFNQAIDQYFTEKYTLTDSMALQIDLQLSGKSAADIVGYDVTKPINDYNNLKALYNAGMGGIKKKEKPNKR